VIIQVLYIMAQLLFLMLLFALVGRPLFFLFRRYFRFFEDFNIIQELVFDLYLGALLLYILALLPLHLFNYYVLLAMLIFCSAFTLVQLSRELICRKLKNAMLVRWKKSGLEQVAVLVLFLLSLGIQVIPLTMLLFGTIHDTSLHALLSQLILENNQIPATHQPYLPAAIVYPQGAHAIFASAALILDMPTPLAVFRVTPLFNALTVFAAYHFGRSLDGRKYAGLTSALVFTFISMWPTHMTWGLNTLVISVPLFIMIATFLGQTLSSETMPEKNESLFYVAIGVFLGFLGALHLSMFLILVLGWTTLALYRCKRYRKVPDELRKIAILIGVSIIFIAPFLFRFISYYSLPGQNIGLPSDIKSPESSQLPVTDPRLSFEGLKAVLLNMPFQYNISPYLPTRLVCIAFFILIPLDLICKVPNRRRMSKAEIVGSMIVTLSILFFLTEPINPIPTISARASFVLYVFFMLLLGSFILFLYRNLLPKAFNAKTVKAAALTLLVLGALFAPFIYYKFTEDPWILKRQYAIFAVTTQDDYNLMLWIKDNLPQTSVTLVNPFEPGLFIPALSQKKVIYPYSAYHLSASYANTTFLIANGDLDLEVFRYLTDHNITHIYVGAMSSSLPEILGLEEKTCKWDVSLFLGNPNFRLLKKIGYAYLFEFQFKDPRMVLLDNFEYDNLGQGGWYIVKHGDGEGNASIIQSTSFTESSSLVLYAKSKGEPYLTSVLRKIYVADTSNVTLSLNLKFATGFSSEDTLILIISDTKRDNFTRAHFTSSGHYQFNVSEMWKDLHDNELPKSFYVEILNFDVDGIENVACVDSINISTNNARLSASYSPSD
jgi:hypothetical protein